MQPLDRDVATQPFVVGPPHDPHPAGPDLLEQAVPTDEDVVARAHVVVSFEVEVEGGGWQGAASALRSTPPCPLPSPPGSTHR